MTSFALDAFSVTVGRFRKFVAAYPYLPRPGSGKARRIADDQGWDPSWNASMPASRAELIAFVHEGCFNGVALGAWTDEPTCNDDRPMDCLTWYEAFAFCIWDGGRLPTEAEWEYAASGGSENRLFPWGTDLPTSDQATLTTWGNIVYPPTNPVGMRPAGNARWGHRDMAGNGAEWVLDWFKNFDASPCDGCAALNRGTCNYRVSRSNAGPISPENLRSARRGWAYPDVIEAAAGVRCARDL